MPDQTTILICYYNAAKRSSGLDWVAREIPEEYTVILLDKFNQGEGKIPNICREDYAYMWYIVHNYDQLKGDYIFLHDDGWGHCEGRVPSGKYNRPPLNKRLEDCVNGRFYNFGAAYSAFDTTPIRDKTRTFAIKMQKGVIDFYRRIFGYSPPPYMLYIRNAQFVLSADRIRKRPLDWYKSYLASIEEFATKYGVDATSGATERQWLHVFMREEFKQNESSLTASVCTTAPGRWQFESSSNHSKWINQGTEYIE